MNGIIGIFILLARPSWSQSPGTGDQVFSLNISGGSNFRDCGINTRLSGNVIPSISPACFQSLNNFYLDSNYTLDRRLGFSAYNTACAGKQSIKGIWPFNATDGTKYLVIFSSNSMFSSKADGTCAIINPYGANWNLSSTAEMECVQAQGQLFCGDGVDQPFYTNVSSSGSLAGAPVGTLIGSFRNRILIAGVTANQTELYLSGELNPYDWTLPSVQSSTSPTVLGINGYDDGLKQNCLMGEFQNQYLIGRDYDLFSLSGYDNRDFTIRRISDQIGCIEPKSVQEVNNQLLWISKRGVEMYTGTQIIPVSYMIRPTILQIISASGNSRSQTLTSQADWNTGNLCASGPNSCMSSAISPGDVVPTTWTVTENSNSLYGAGTAVNSTYTATSVFISNPGSQVWINAGGESGDFTNWNLQACSPACGAGGGWQNRTASFTCQESGGNVSRGHLYGSWAFDSGNTQDGTDCNISIIGSVIDGVTGVVLSSADYKIANAIQNSRWINSPLDTSNFNSTTVKLKFSYTDSFGTNVLTSSAIARGNNIPLQYSKCYTDHNACILLLDMDETLPQITSGTYTSKCYDTGISTPVWGNFNATIVSSSADSGLTFQTQAAASCSGTFDAQAAATIGSVIPSANKEFIRYVSSFTLNAATDTPASFSSVNLTAATTGYYVTECILVSSPTSWGGLTVDAVTNGGSLTFWTSTGPTCAASTATNVTWNLQNANAQISVTTATTYVAERVLFTGPDPTKMPTLNDITFGWNAGTSRPPTSSLQYNDRYYLFYTTNTTGTPANDHSVVYDFNGKWTFLDDIHAYSSTLYLNSPYIGDSNSTGLIYQFDSGQSDNGGSFTSSFKTGDLDFGAPAQMKQFERLYLFVNAPASSAQSISLTCQYSLDGSSVTYPLQSYNLQTVPEPTSGGYGVAKYPFAAGTNPTHGHWVNVQCSYSGTDGPLSISGLQIVWKPESFD